MREKLMSEHLRGMLINDVCVALFHSDIIKDKENFIADITELINNYVVSKDEN